MYKTVIFDLDGTLFQTDSVFVDAVNAVCLERGVKPWDRERLIRLIGEPMVEICRRVFGEDLGFEEIEEIRAEVRKKQGIHMAERGRLYEGTADMLERLRAEGYRLCICSNGSEPHVEAVLKNFDLRQLFAVVKTRIEGLSKAQLIKQILDEVSCCNAVIVGDRSIDFEAAAEAGCLSVGVSYGYGGIECEQADYIAHSALEVYEIICQISELHEHARGMVAEKAPYRVRLENVAYEHFEELVTLHLEPEVVEMLGVIALPQEIPTEDENNLTYSILDEEDRFIGIIELFNISWRNKRAEMSISIKAEHRGKGYGYEAVMQLLNIGFERLGFNRIWLRVLEHNHGAIACYKKAGFVQEGVCREESLRGGSFKNQLQMSILRSERLHNNRLL